MTRIKMIVEYDGSRYHGFQIQENANTVQAELQSAVKQVSGESVSILCAGRTDAGVHAQGQVIAFDTNSSVPGEKWKFALNSFLPPDIHAVASAECDSDFHPRFHALSKVYKYRIYRQARGRIFHRHFAFCSTEPLNLEVMEKACQALLGRHDFRSFCASGSSVKTFERTVKICRLLEEGPCLCLEIEADGFLYNMVRIITGTLLQIGRGIYPPDAMKDIINARNRSQAGPTAPPHGLYLMEVKY